MPKSLSTLLAGIVDYAGLFPPAALTMSEAVKSYCEHLAGNDSWMLGRFIVPMSRIEEFEHHAQLLLPLDSSPWRLSALCGMNFQDDAEAVAEFNGRNIGAVIDSVEIKATRVEEILAAAAVFPDSLSVFVEIPIDKDPTELVDAVAASGLLAKVRTGGITRDAFPSGDAVVRFIANCLTANARFKATAGLHHPIRGLYKLTYDEASARAPMYGFLNVVLAAAFIAHGLGRAEAEQILYEESPDGFHFDDLGVTWRSHKLTLAELKGARTTVVASFGSCSFREPVADLKALQLI